VSGFGVARACMAILKLALALFQLKSFPSLRKLKTREDREGRFLASFLCRLRKKRKKEIVEKTKSFYPLQEKFLSIFVNPIEGVFSLLFSFFCAIMIATRMNGGYHGTQEATRGTDLQSFPTTGWQDGELDSAL